MCAMKKIPLIAIEQNAPLRGPGYREDVMRRASVITEVYIEVSDADWVELVRKWRPDKVLKATVTPGKEGVPSAGCTSCGRPTPPPTSLQGQLSAIQDELGGM